MLRRGIKTREKNLLFPEKLGQKNKERNFQHEGTNEGGGGYDEGQKTEWLVG